MSRNRITIISILAGLILVAIFFGSAGKKPLNWNPTYNTKDKIPLGLYIFDKEVDSFFHVYVERYKDDLKDYFYEGVFEDSVLYDYCMMNINMSFDVDKKQTENLCSFVKNGNSVFLSAGSFSESLMNRLKLEVFNIPYSTLSDKNHENIKIYLQDSTAGSKIIGQRTITGSYFISYDSASSQVLGYRMFNKVVQPNFIKVKMGLGHFFIHLEPAAFSNYHIMTGDDYKYAEAVLTHIPYNQDIIWLLHKQTSRVISDSPLRFILSQPPLKWAWYLLITGLLAFIIFNIRRSQRIIPDLPPPANTSVEFAKTVGNLYRREGDIKNIIDKKIIYFLEKIRTDYHLHTDVLDEKFAKMLHIKSGKDIKIIERIVLLINKQRNFDFARSTHDLQQLNDTFENFYKS